MNKPSNFNSSIDFNPLTNTYIIQNKIGEINIDKPQILSFPGGFGAEE